MKESSGNGREMDLPRRCLTNKMVSALDHMGYTEQDQSTVMKLITHNARSVCGSVAKRGPNEEQTNDVRTLIDDVVSKFEAFNSNEPIVMITFEDIAALEEARVQRITGETLRQFRIVHNIRPVRMLIASGSPWERVEADLESLESQAKVSLTLINVVNTDIGGPSMIQLLDHRSAPEEWVQLIVSVEAWNHDDLLWRIERPSDQRRGRIPSETDVSPPHQEYGISDRNDTSVQHMMQNLGTGRNGDHELVASDTEIENSPAADKIGDETITSVVPTNHPAFAELHEGDLEAKQISHPTWEHVEGSSSLADLIRQQASQLSSHSKESGLAGLDLEGVGPMQKSIDGFEVL